MPLCEDNVTQPVDISSPEQLHRALRVVRRRGWLALLSIAGVIMLATGYLILGRIPITAKGEALFLTPSTVVPFQATGSGQIVRWRIKVGDHVKKGQVLALLDQPLITK